MFRDGVIDRDDEVAITFDAQSLAALCQPLVNVRHALERLSAGGTLPRPMARRILRAAQAMPYFDRVYPLILARAGLADHADAAQLANMLAAHDLKRDDAITLLEHLRALGPGCPAEADRAPVADPVTAPPGAPLPAAPQADAPQPDAPLHMWEFGPPLPFHALVEFLALTGGLRTVALRAAAALGVGMDVAMDVDEAGIDGAGLQDRFDRRLAQVGRAWHWVTEEEVATSLHDLGIGEEGLQQALLAEITNEQRAMAMVRSASPAFMQALRYQLFLDDLALKRETARAASLHAPCARARHQARTNAPPRARSCAASSTPAIFPGPSSSWKPGASLRRAATTSSIRLHWRGARPASSLLRLRPCHAGAGCRPARRSRAAASACRRPRPMRLPNACSAWSG
jgi:ribosomal protein S12 methylthiotransferase accessory factor